jgi:hypothetical protein
MSAERTGIIDKTGLWERIQWASKEWKMRTGIINGVFKNATCSSVVVSNRSAIKHWFDSKLPRAFHGTVPCTRESLICIKVNRLLLQ